MLKSTHIKLSIFIITVAGVIAIVFKNMNMPEMSDYKSSSGFLNPVDKLKEVTSDEESNSGENTNYFSIFRFVNNLIPGKE